MFFVGGFKLPQNCLLRGVVAFVRITLRSGQCVVLVLEQTLSISEAVKQEIYKKGPSVFNWSKTSR